MWNVTVPLQGANVALWLPFQSVHAARAPWHQAQSGSELLARGQM